MIAIVLAAGRGSRLGGPKALLGWRRTDGRRWPLAAVHAQERLEAESERVLVVVRQSEVSRLASWLPPGARCVVSTAPEELGPAGSIGAAAAQLAEPTEAPCGPTDVVLVTPVDCVPPQRGTVDRLVQALRDDPSLLAARPRAGDRHGHPVALRAALLERYRGGSAPPLRDLLRSLGGQVAAVAVDDPSVLVDLDRPEDVVRVGQGPLCFVSTPRAGG